MPELSIIMPLYNTEMYVAQAIQSLLSQTYTGFELIIVDDGSTDKSLEIVKSFKDSRIKIMRNQQNQGIVFSRNRGLKEAVGEYIAPFDSDDIAMPDKFEKQINFLKDHPEYGMIGSWTRMIDESGNLLKSKWKLPAKWNHIPSILLFRNYFVQSSIVIRRNAIPSGGYNVNFNVGEDYRMWIEVSRKFKVWNFPEYLVHYRVHSKSITQKDTEGLINKEKKIFDVLFNPLEIELDDCKISSLLIIKNNERIKHLIQLKYIEAILLEILNQNLKLKVYGQKQLTKAVFNRWLKSCYKARGLHLKMIKHFFISPLLKYYFGFRK